MNAGFDLWPQAASDYAHRLDGLIWAFSSLVVLLTAPVFILIVVFAIRYRRGKPADREQPPNRSVLIETSWTVLPFLLTVGFFIYAALLFFQLHGRAPDALTIDVVARQWMWKFQHPEGQREIDTLHVPAGQAVTLVMTSQDVIHSLYLPALRIKQDVLPGRYTTLSFTAERPGTYRLHCAEFCGTDHAVMGGSLEVMRPEDYARWLQQSGVDASLAEQGQALFRSLGCSGCHGPSARVHAPKLEGVFGRPTPLSDGRIVIADEQYVHDSIMQPNRDIAAGYPAIMPTFGNVLSEEQVTMLVAYVKSLAAQEAAR